MDGQQNYRQDSTANKIFVGGLSWESTIKDIREYFEAYGTVVDATLKTDPNTGKSRGFGFVTFENSSVVDAVLADKKHMLNGKKIDPKKAQSRGDNHTMKKIFVGGIDPNMPEEEIKNYFSQFGPVADVDLPFDKMKNQRRAFCFITFETEEAVDAVCVTQKQDINGRQVDVKRATPQQKKENQGYNQWGGDQQGGYDYSGGYGGYGGAQGGGGYDYSSYGQGGAGGGQQQYDYSGYYQQQGQQQQGGGSWGGYGGQQGGGADYSQQGGYDYNSGYNQGSSGGYDHSGYQGYDNSQGGGYDYGSQGQDSSNQGGGYDYQGQSSQGGGYDYNEYQGQSSQGDSGYGGGKSRGGGSGGSSRGGGDYHPYSRQ